MPRIGSRIIVVATVLAAMLTLMSIACSEAEPTAVPATATVAPTQVPATATPEPPTPTPVPAEPLQIVATSNIIGDWVRIVGGDHIEVTDLVPRGSDPHAHQPGARDIARVADADIVFTVGLALEGQWLEELVENAAADHDVVIALAELVDPIEYHFEGGDPHGHGDEHADEDEHAHEDEDEHHDEDADGHDHDDEHADEDEDEHHDEDADGHDHDDEHADEDEDEHHDEDADGHDHDDEHADEDEDEHHDEDADGHDHDDEHADEDEHEGHDDEHAMEGSDGHEGHDHGSLDPHFWLEPNRVAIAVEEIAHELSEIDPDNAADYDANRDAFIAELTALDKWIDEEIAKIPVADRLLVTTHDAFGYFAARYGFEIVGVIIPGGGTEIERSPQEFAELVERVQEEGASVVFAEAQLSDRLANTLATEAGIKFVRGLLVGSLSPDGGTGPTYLEMMRHNVNLIVDSLTH